jgi:hypothetical protein
MSAYTPKEVYDMVMIHSALELLDRMPDVSRCPILIETLPSPPRVIPTPTKTLGPRLHPSAPKAKAAKAKTVAATKATAAAKAELVAAKAALKEAKAAAKAVEKELAKLRAGTKAKVKAKKA